MARMFNVSTDEQERHKIINAISRLRLMRKNGAYEPVIVYGRESHWQVRSATTMIEIYEKRLRELDAK